MENGQLAENGESIFYVINYRSFLGGGGGHVYEGKA
jgi:hypothetical protein